MPPPFGLLAKVIERWAKLRMPKKSLNDELLRAIELALSGEWEGAHNLVQQHEDDAVAAWIHAVLHKIEGDLGNAGYWYRRAGRMDRMGEESQGELRAIREKISVKS